MFGRNPEYLDIDQNRIRRFESYELATVAVQAEGRGEEPGVFALPHPAVNLVQHGSCLMVSHRHLLGRRHSEAFAVGPRIVHLQRQHGSRGGRRAGTGDQFLVIQTVLQALHAEFRGFGPDGLMGLAVYRTGLLCLQLVQHVIQLVLHCKLVYVLFLQQGVCHGLEQDVLVEGESEFVLKVFAPHGHAHAVTDAEVVGGVVTLHVVITLAHALQKADTGFGGAQGRVVHGLAQIFVGLELAGVIQHGIGQRYVAHFIQALAPVGAARYGAGRRQQRHGGEREVSQCPRHGLFR